MEPAPTREHQAKLDDLNHGIQAVQALLVRGKPALDKAQTAWERQISQSGQQKQRDVFWAPARGLDLNISFEDEKKVPVAPGRIGAAGVFDGKTELNAGNVAGYDIENRFTLSPWVYSDSVPDGSVVSKMLDKPQGKGYGVYLNQGKVHVHLTSNYDDDAIRLETETPLAAHRWYHLTVTYSGSRMAEGVGVYIDGKPAPAKVLLATRYLPFRNPGGDVNGGGASAEGNAPADPRGLRQARRESAVRCAGRAAAAACGSAEQSPRVRQVADRSRKSAHRARDREPLLANVFRYGHCEDHGRFRITGRVAIAPGIARLAGHGIRPHRLGREGDAEAHRDQRHLPPVIESQPGSVAARPRESVAGTRSALEPAVPAGQRPGPTPMRPTHRKTPPSL